MPKSTWKSVWITNFGKYNPPHKATNKAVRSGGPIPWCRLERDWYDDKDIASMAEPVRWIWPALMGQACKSRPPGRIDMTADELAREFRTTAECVVVAVDHLWKRGRVRFTRLRVVDATDASGEGVA